VIVDVAFDAS
jgi:ATP-dependent RNA helicase DDX18/HAS1